MGKGRFLDLKRFRAHGTGWRGTEWRWEVGPRQELTSPMTLDPEKLDADLSSPPVAWGTFGKFLVSLDFFF